VAVGESSSDFPGFLAVHWNGRRWTQLAVSYPINVLSVAPESIDCTSATFCMALGRFTSMDFEPGWFVSRWNGSTWRVEPLPTPGLEQVLRDIDCFSPVACMAVGHYNGFDGLGQPFTARWNGTAWRQLPSDSTQLETFLTSVSCPTRHRCYSFGASAVPDEENPEPDSGRVFLQTWYGRSMNVSQHLVRHTNALIADVDCFAKRACVAVGSAREEGSPYWTAVSLVREGSRWQSAHVDGSWQSSGLAGVSCAWWSRCTAVGSFADAFREYPLTSTWNGDAWRSRRVPGPSSVDFALLSAVDCPTRGYCLATGISYTNAFGTNAFAVERS
jgi:hypothetical protein